MSLGKLLNKNLNFRTRPFGTEPPDDDGDDSPFSKTGGLFSASKGLFDDDEEDGQVI